MFEQFSAPERNSQEDRYAAYVLGIRVSSDLWEHYRVANRPPLLGNLSIWKPPEESPYHRFGPHLVRHTPFLTDAQRKAFEKRLNDKICETLKSYNIEVGENRLFSSHVFEHPFFKSVAQGAPAIIIPLSSLQFLDEFPQGVIRTALTPIMSSYRKLEEKYIRGKNLEERMTAICLGAEWRAVVTQLPNKQGPYLSIDTAKMKDGFYDAVKKFFTYRDGRVTMMGNHLRIEANNLERLERLVEMLGRAPAINDFRSMMMRYREGQTTEGRDPQSKWGKII